jgi:uncharacterized membrane protein
LSLKLLTTAPFPRISRHLVVVVFLALLQIGFFGFYGYLRHSNYLTSINDLGQYDQAIWGFLNGTPFLNSIILDNASWLSQHFTLILALFVPFYVIHPTVFWLIFAQAIALPLTAIPLFYIAKGIFKSETIACLWAIIYMCNPYVLNAASWDFQTATLAVPLIALGFYALEYKNFRLLLVSCFFILLCKEHFGLLVVGFGLLWAIRHRELKPALFLVLLGVTCFALIVGVLMPMLNPSGELLMMSTGKGQLSRYGWLGSTAGEVFLRILNDPIDIIRTILVTMGGWVYLLGLALPFLCFSLFEFWLLLPGLADLAVNLLSANSMPRSIYAYHSATLVPVFMVSAMYGLHRFSKISRTGLILGITVSCLFVSVFMGYFLSSFYPLPGIRHSWAPQKVVPYNDPVLLEVKELAGTHSASVQANLGAHFSQRMEVYRFPSKIGEADMIILNLDSPTTLKQGYDPGMIGTLAHHLQMDPQLYLETVGELLINKRYGVVLWKTPWLVLEKNASHDKDVENIELRLQTLAVEWK